MADGYQTIGALLDTVPNQRELNAGAVRSDDEFQRARDAIITLHRWAREYACTRAIAGGQSSDGGTQTIAAYGIDLSALAVTCGGNAAEIAALTDVDMLAAATAIDLAGAAPTALTADGKTCWVVLAVVLIGTTPTLYYIFGDEANDMSEVKPDSDDVKAALALADPANYDPTVGVIVGEILVKRVATDTINMTHTAVTTASLALLRGQGTLGSIPTDSALASQ